MIDITTLRAMAAAGASVEVILAAVEAMAEGERVQAGRNAARQQKWRDKHNVTLHPVTLRNVTSQESLTSLLSSSTSTTKEAESKEVSKKERARKSQLPADWKPSPEHYAKAAKQNLPAEFVDRKADDLRDWALGKGVMRADWDRTFNGFLKPNEAQNGQRGSRQFQNDELSVTGAIRKLGEQVEQGKLTFAPRPSLLPTEGGNDRRL